MGENILGPPVLNGLSSVTLSVSYNLISTTQPIFPTQCNCRLLSAYSCHRTSLSNVLNARADYRIRQKRKAFSFLSFCISCVATIDVRKGFLRLYFPIFFFFSLPRVAKAGLHTQGKMDRGNTIEHLLLSRCSKFSDDGEKLQFLENRYSATGTQKNYLILESTDGGQSQLDTVTEQKKDNETIKHFLKSSASNTNINNQIKKLNKHNPLKTKNQFKLFLKKSLKHQENTIKKLNKLAKKNPELLNSNSNTNILDLKICNKLLKFSDFIQLNILWNSYIDNLLDNNLKIDAVTSKLSSAEFVGAYFKVTHSSCHDYIGLEGIVLWESQTYILLIVPPKNSWKNHIHMKNINIPYSVSDQIGGLKMILKKKTRFTFEINLDSNDDTSNNVIEFEYIGDRMSIRSVDRANKKFKNHNVKDIEL